jgi:hypothetical protein
LRNPRICSCFSSGNLDNVVYTRFSLVSKVNSHFDPQGKEEPIVVKANMLLLRELGVELGVERVGHTKFIMLWCDEWRRTSMVGESAVLQQLIMKDLWCIPPTVGCSILFSWLNINHQSQYKILYYFFHLFLLENNSVICQEIL